LQRAPKKELTLFDSTCLIVGIIIGAGIYKTAPDVAKGAAGSLGVLAIWVVGGLLSLCGALGYAELATAYPREGGDYVYLSRAYGRWAGFLFGWMQLAVVRPCDIAAMAFAFATYAQMLYDPLQNVRIPYGKLPFLGASPDAAVPCSLLVYAILSVVVLTAINVLGVREGKWTQNVLTSVKALGLLAIVGVALVGPRTPPVTESIGPFPLSVAMILVLFTFGGWNEMAYVAAEVKDSRRNIVRALVLGTAAVTLLYLLVNGAFLWTLGYQGTATSKAVATDTVSALLPTFGGRAISALVCISALGAINGLIFTGARISYAVGAEHRAFRALGQWHPRTGTPVHALLVQGILAICLIVALGSFVDTIIYAAPAVYTFYMATTLSVIVLRFKEPEVERPYRVTGYPVVPLVFCGVCGLLIYKSVEYAVLPAPMGLGKPWIVAVPFVVLSLGLPIYWLSRPRRVARGDDGAASPPSPGRS
jgi:amino acid transporter